MIEKYDISDDISRLDFEFIYSAIASTYWAKGIPEKTMRKAIENSICFGAYKRSGKQVAFARMVTDYATFAYLADVYVDPAHRGHGISKLMMEEMMRHPDLQGLRRIMLATKDAHGLYQQFGFTDLNKPEYFMERWDPDIYQRSVSSN